MDGNDLRGVPPASGPVRPTGEAKRQGRRAGKSRSAGSPGEAAEAVPEAEEAGGEEGAGEKPVVLDTEA